MAATNNNIWLTDLSVGDEVIEQFYGSSLASYISTITSIDNQFIVTSRGNKYDTSSGRIVYPINSGRICNAFLLQKDYPTEGTPFHPSDIPDNAQVLIPDPRN